MKNSKKKIGIGAIIAIILIVIFVVKGNSKVQDFHEKYEGYDLTQDVEGMERQGTYTKYLLAHDDAAYPQNDVEINLFKYEAEGSVSKVDNCDGVDSALETETGSKVTWKVNVPESGFYNLYMEFQISKSRGVAAERAVYINGEIPFEDARNISFARMWTDDGDVKVDNQGNEIRPTQMEVFGWQSALFKDDMGYITEPYQFYFEKGENELTLEAENEPIILKTLTLKAIKATDTYEEYLAKQPQTGSQVKGVETKIEGETSTLRSESSLYAKYDRSSPTTSPNSVTTTVLNYVGGEAWRAPGQWVEWEFEVPEDGFYNIMIKGRQNYSRGSVSNRIVYIDGEIPFEEMKEVSFEYGNDWNCKKLADENGNEYEFYLTKGTHTIRLEATLGGMGEILEELEDSIYRLNQIYRTVLVYTGATPDKYRDYNIHQVYPEVMEAMDLESKRLYKIVDDMVTYSGQKADNIASAQTVAQQLERFVKKPNKITLEFTTFKDNITALGTASLNMSATYLDVDYLVVSSTDVHVKEEKASFAAKAWHELKSFVASFTVDYDAVGDVYAADDEGVIKVWILTGRDQGTILKSMVDDSFTPNSGVKVNVEIVDPGALLNAVVAGRGPNVVLSVAADQPVNYALRNASEDITQFEGWEEVLSHYEPSSYEQYRLPTYENGVLTEEHIYGIPETQTFNVMFYRKDVLDQLGLEVPNTWQDLIEMLPTIQGNNMTIGIPTAYGSSAGASTTAIANTNGDLSMYFSLLYQYGGDMYNYDGTKTVVNSEEAIKAFDDYTRYFNDYGIPTVYDFVSRFRSGEMPIGIQAYSVYNTLMVSAPEIRGLWDFTLIPGTPRFDENGDPILEADGTQHIDRSDFITGQATMMIKCDDELLKQNSWEFMKWWASIDTQVQFGREIEALLGSSARYNTANKDAFSQLKWSEDDIAVLSAQWEQTVGIREVPGGYYTGRHITNAIRKVINEKEDARETIIDYSIKIDEEIIKKRKEFGLPVEE